MVVFSLAGVLANDDNDDNGDDIDSMISLKMVLDSCKLLVLVQVVLLLLLLLELVSSVIVSFGCCKDAGRSEPILTVIAL